VKVVGLYLVRNEVDIIETNLRYHLAGVIDEAIVIDNGATDGALQRLRVRNAGSHPGHRRPDPRLSDRPPQWRWC
jgi:hypothetical protein